MRGKYDDPALRAATREQWAADNVRAIRWGEVKPLRPLLRRSRDLVAIDVGANKGFWAKALLNALGDAVAHVHMLDPSPENYRELTRREDNLIFDPEDFSRLSTYRVAAGAAAGTARLYTNEDGSPLASLYRHETNGYPDGQLAELRLDDAFEAPMTTIDDFIAEHGLAQVDLMKIDVEGHEFAVLQGADAALREGRIQVVSWEFGMHQVESRHFFVDFHRYLTERGYELHRLIDGSPYRIERYDYSLENFTDNFQFAARRIDLPG